MYVVECPSVFTWECVIWNYTIFFSPFILNYSTSLSHAGNSGHLSWVRLQLLQEQRYPLLPVHAVFLCVRQWHGCQRLGYLTCAQMLMHAIAGRGCTKTTRESAVKADPGRKICCCTGERKPVSVGHGSTSWEILLLNPFPAMMSFENDP